MNVPAASSPADNSTPKPTPSLLGFTVSSGLPLPLTACNSNHRRAQARAASYPRTRLPYVAGEDVARTAAAVLRADPVPPGELAITGPQALTAEALVNSINIIFGASIDLVPVSEEALALHLQVSGFPKSTVREALIIEEVSKRGLAPFSDGVIEQMTGQPPRSIEAVLVEHRLDLLLSTSTPRL